MKRDTFWRSQRPQAVLFDLDGTLLHSAVHFVDILQDLVPAAKSFVNDQSLRPYISGGVLSMLRYALGDHADFDTVSALRTQFLEAYEDKLRHSSDVYFDGIEPMLAALQHQGIPCGIVTNKQQCFGEAILDKASFKTSMACAVYGDTLTANKPSPEPLWFACRQLAVDPKATWFVGDSLVDMQAADRAGCPALLAAYGYVQPGWPRWPYDATLQQPQDLIVLLKDANS
jgi:2-phosphoglycolate phosphatase